MPAEHGPCLGVFDGTHDAGAAVVVGGRLVAAVSEERLVRDKGAAGWPAASVAAVLASAGVRPAELAAVAFAGRVNPNPALRLARGAQARWRFDEPRLWDPDGWRSRLAEATQLQSPFPRLRSDSLAARAWTLPLRWALGRRLAAELPGLRAPVAVHDHHRCHAAAAWFTFGVERGLVIVADGVGDGQALTVWRGQGGALVPLRAWPFPDSHGLVYATLTAILGFRPFRHEGKVAGLAAHGDPDAVPVPWPFVGPPDARRLACGLGPGLRAALAPLRACRREDVCAWLQRGLEADLCGLLDAVLRETGESDVALCGGVFANVRLNQRLAERPGMRRLWVFPHMGDGGLAAGAALLSAGAAPVALPSAALGPDLDPAELGAALASAPEARASADPAALAARLRRGQLIALCRGRSEFGPRALGQRSILACPADPAVVDRLNAALQRSAFMPFAPAVRAEDIDEAVDLAPSARAAARFMTVTAEARPALRAAAPAVVHADGSARVQVVHADEAPLLHAILSAYRALGGGPALLNTSFNLHEEPIVQTAGDALRSWRAAGLDGLVLGEALLVQGEGGAR
ncbi:MAG: hypothetical protein JNM72_23175 [Deltaproteobacteria bacterium]|nr:hypothetical protein [Deltaproteobacteria bacterium]